MDGIREWNWTQLPAWSKPSFTLIFEMYSVNPVPAKLFCFLLSPIVIIVEEEIKVFEVELENGS